ncbi:unnamed protein product [Heterotrigona itama]|uniref:Uncharacterized protein n=1 Tax=Heterotrigona itama TaxID=395501 RepID=A0A6V7HE43_9HYME|nr:unnamed protein product [Heterotrigona itama]
MQFRVDLLLQSIALHPPRTIDRFNHSPNNWRRFLPRKRKLLPRDNSVMRARRAMTIPRTAAFGEEKKKKEEKRKKEEEQRRDKNSIRRSMTMRVVEGPLTWLASLKESANQAGCI